MSSDPLIDKFQPLPLVRLVGPRLGVDDPRPLWRLWANAPKFGAEKAEDPNGKKNGETADDVFGVRLLLANAPNAQWLQPRLLSLHLAYGAPIKTPYQSDNEGLELAFAPTNEQHFKNVIRNIIRKDRILAHVLPEPPISAATLETPFVHVVGEPLASDGKWPEGESRFPQIRLITGRVGLDIDVHENEFSWLSQLAKVDGEGERVKLWLTPQGIEFDANLPVPWSKNGESWGGRVRLTSEIQLGTPIYFITLLWPEDEKKWLDAWRSITPRPSEEDILTGLTIKADHSKVPTFRWALKTENGKLEWDAHVQVDGVALAVTLRGNTVRGEADGAAQLKFQWFGLSKDGADDVYEFQGQAGDLQAPMLKLVHDPDSLRLELPEKEHPLMLDIDDDALAQDLRECYSLPAPPLRSSHTGNGPPINAPLLPAFVPLPNGWLQLPIPNLPPIDTSKDANLADTKVEQAESVLLGYIRLRRPSAAAQVLSAHQTPAAAPETGLPFDLTIDAAAGASAVIKYQKDKRLIRTVVKLHGVSISANGLLLVSADRPDAFEALPRLGAGPGLILPVSVRGIHAKDNIAASVVGLTLAELVIEAFPAQPGGHKEQMLEIANATMDLTFNPLNRRWLDLLARDGAWDAINAAKQVVDRSSDTNAGEIDQTKEMEKLQAAIKALEKLVECRRQSAEATWLWERARLDFDTLAQRAESIRQTRRQYRQADDDLFPGLSEELDDLFKQSVDENEKSQSKFEKTEEARKASSERYGAAKKDAEKAAKDLFGTRAVPLPAVNWRRHPVMPLAASMPMTRVARSAVRPLESRDLIPYWIAPGKALVEVALISGSLVRLFRRNQELPAIVPDNTTSVPLAGWPWARTEVGRPTRGVFFSAIGVPGVEWRPSEDNQFAAALRYDLPTLDEAFATAELPPAPPESKASVVDVQIPDELETIPTALDWAALGNFWKEQERRLQNSRVVGSYVTPFGGLKDTSPVDNLIQGKMWPVEVTLSEGKYDPNDPKHQYGHVILKPKGGTAETHSANRALLGHTQRYWISGGRLVPNGGGEPVVEIVGYAPSTFFENHLNQDNQSMGAGVVEESEKFTKRGILIQGSSYTLVSLKKRLDVPSLGLAFWFKDALINSDENFVSPGETDQDGKPVGGKIDFEVWTKPKNLAAAGLEWRLASLDGDAQDFARGLNRISFQGFELEPLQLDELKIKTTGPKPEFVQATIVCQLSLGQRDQIVDPGKNLVRLTLLPQPGSDFLKWVINDETLFTFPLDCKMTGIGGDGILDDSIHGQGRRRVVLALSLAAKSTEFSPIVKDLSLTLAGSETSLVASEVGAQLSCERGKVIVRITRNDNEKVGEGVLTVRQLVLEVVDSKSCRVGWESELVIPIVHNTYTNSVLRLMTGKPGASSEGKLFGITINEAVCAIEEGAGGLTASVVGHIFLSKTKLNINLCLAARVLPPQSQSHGVLSLGLGSLEGLLRQEGDDTEILPGITLKQGSAKVFAESKETIEDSKKKWKWEGNLTLYGLVNAKSAIEWPFVKKAEPADIPVPGKKTDGRLRVKPVEAVDGRPVGAKHEVTWCMAGHKLPLELILRILSDDSDAIWAVPVVARHKLCLALHNPAAANPENEINWSGIESIAMGALQAIIPPLPTLGTSFSTDTVTFAPRGMAVLEKGKNTGNSVGMKSAGLGAVATVLQGSLGAAFRRAFHNTYPKPEMKVIIAGGFLGMLEPEIDVIPNDRIKARPLLRLPVLAGIPRIPNTAGTLQGAIAQRALAEKEFEMAWADTPAARLVALTDPTGPKPANESLDAIEAALVAGSRTLPSKSTDEVGDPVGAWLVEQCFPQGEFLEKVNEENEIPGWDPDIGHRPYFLAAAVSISEMFAKRQFKEGKLKLTSHSLVAGYLPVGNVRQPLAASIRMANREGIESKPLFQSELVIIGDRITRVPRVNAGSLENNTQNTPTLIASVTDTARHYDLNPVAAIVVQHTQDGIGKYTPVLIDNQSLCLCEEEPDCQPHFADSSRGPLYISIADDSIAKLSPPIEGPARPIRDDSGEHPSGIAGLTRSIRLSRQAGESLKLGSNSEPGAAQNENRTTDFVWLTQSRVPIYQPLLTKNLAGPSIGWLMPAASKVRLPPRISIEEALIAGREESTKVELQPFLPGAMDMAEVGERAGVLTVRRVRLLGEMSDKVEYDADYARFGRPAQVGSSFARTLRTPRPGPLPVNRGNPQSDRRIQASPLRPFTPIDALLGSADFITGKNKEFGKWAITVSALSTWRSIVTDNWDGSIKLSCRVVLETPTTTNVEGVLAALLLAPTLTSTNPPASAIVQMKSRMMLKIGNVTIPYHELFWKSPTTAQQQWTTAGAEFIVDVERNLNVPIGTPFPSIAQALRNKGVLPTVELQWTVCPFDKIELINRQARWVFETGEQSALQEGQDRAPVTLRFPLYPVTSELGALPVKPASLLFNDPAYDRFLANVPVSDSKLAVTTTDPQQNRGGVRFSLHADRRQVHRLESLTLMLDLRFEKPLDDVAQLVAEKNGAGPGGDLREAVTQPMVDVEFKVQPKDGIERSLRLRPVSAQNPTSNLQLIPGRVYELALAALLEHDGAPATLLAGDALVIAARAPSGNQFHLVSSSGTQIDISLGKVCDVGVRVLIADGPTTPPPPALYAALLRTTRAQSGGSSSCSIATALHAQSPLPARTDLWEPARDFRKGLMRRQATFVWTLLRPEADFAGRSLIVIKQDRNGQTWLPETHEEFIEPVELNYAGGER